MGVRGYHVNIVFLDYDQLLPVINMAKNIKAIKCPNCGSIKKNEIKTDYYVCLSCNTEYFLDNDDININIKHVPHSSSQQSTARVKRIIATILLAFILVLIFFIVIKRFVGNSIKSIPSEKEIVKYDYYGGEIVYQNSNTGKAIFLRMARESILDKDNRADYVNTHTIFIDPVSKK